MNRPGANAALSLPVECAVRGHKRAGHVHDLTREGCLLDCGHGFAAAGDQVALRFRSGLRLHGRVTLVHGRIGRIEFDQPLHEGIFTHLSEHEAGMAAN